MTMKNEMAFAANARAESVQMKPQKRRSFPLVIECRIGKHRLYISNPPSPIFSRSLANARKFSAGETLVDDEVAEAVEEAIYKGEPVYCTIRGLMVVADDEETFNNPSPQKEFAIF